MTAFTIAKAESAEQWAVAVERSPHYSVFLHPAFLRALGAGYEAWMVWANGRPAVGALVVEPDNASFTAPFPFSSYQGLAMIDSRPTVHGDVRHTLEAIGYLVEELSGRYSRLSFSLHHRLTDLRALQWFNYHTPERGRFTFDLQYTGIVRFADYSSFDAYVGTTRDARQAELKKAMRAGLEITESGDVEAFERLYALTFERQGITLDARHRERVRAITTAATREGIGQLRFCGPPGGDPMSATVFLHDRRTAYYMFGATEPQYRNAGASTYLLFDNIRRYWEAGLTEIDVCGINSPNRGDFKTSLNAIPTPHFSATWTRPS